MIFSALPHRIKQVLLLIVLLIVFFLAGTALFHEYGSGLPMGGKKQILQQLSLGSENVAAAWFSSMLLLLAGLLSLVCYFSDRQRFKGAMQQGISAGWLFTAAVFMLLSFDEMGSVHETIGETALFKGLGKGAGWLVFQILVAAVGFAMMVFAWVRLRRVPWALALFITGVLMYLSNPFQENFEIASFHNAADPHRWKRPLFFLLLEEGSELAGSFCFISACIVYLRKATAVMGKQGIQVSLPAGKNFYFRLFWSIVAVGAVVLLLVGDEQQKHQTETGIAQNWFPSAMAFLLFTAAVYFGTRPQALLINRKTLWVLGLLALGTSVAAGIDIFGAGAAQHPVFRMGMAAGCILVFFLMLWLRPPTRTGAVRLFLFLWLAFTACSIFLPQLFANLFLYCGTCCLLGVLAAQFANPSGMHLQNARTLKKPLINS